MSSPPTCTNYRDRCQRSMFVARDEHEKVDVITCPLPNCSHKWCKKCQKSGDFGGLKHSCGTEELDDLMKEKGWKYCPSESPSAHCHFSSSNYFFSSLSLACKTPIEKITGCSHMFVRQNVRIRLPLPLLTPCLRQCTASGCKT